MRRVVLLLPVVLLAAGAAWSQGGAGGRLASALEPGLDVAPTRTTASTQEPLTLCAAPRVGRPRAMRRAHGDASLVAAAPAHASPAVQVPPDPLESGACTLVVSLTDEAGQDAGALEVQLWRLDAPANERWSAGDRLQAEGNRVQGRMEWRDLPAGRYRVFAPGRRASAEDPAPFFVGEPTTSITLALALPRPVPVLVHVVDENGAPLTRAWWGAESKSWIEHGSPPDWAVARARLDDPEPFSCAGCRGARTRGCGGTRRAEVHATAEGFALGTCPERMVRRSISRREGLRFEGRSSVGLRVDSNDARAPVTLRYVAVSVPLEVISAYIWTSDGRLAREAGATFHVQCTGIHVPEGTAAPDPRELPIYVHVSLPGHAPLEYTTRLRERPVDRTLFPGR